MFSLLLKDLISDFFFFDEKKIKQGLTAHSGDVDLLGFEEGLSQNELTETLKEIQTLLVEISDQSQDENVKDLDESIKYKILQTLKHAHTKMSQLAQEIRELRRKKEFAKSKFIERGGEDCRNGWLVVLRLNVPVNNFSVI